MVRIIETTELNLGNQLSEWRYNGLDSCITLEVLGALLPQLDEITRPVYERALALQGPILEMECRGIKTDREEIRRVSVELEGQLTHLHDGLREILIEGLGFLPEEVSWLKTEQGKKVEKFWWNSPAKLKVFFYDQMGLPKSRKKGIVTCDRDALEKMRSYFFAEPIINHILAIRDINKSLGVLRTSIDSDGRIRYSLNIAGTDTGRLASYASAMGSGTNMQNITEELRQIFVADPGKKLAYIDRAQIQSRAVGAICWNLFHDGTYLDFCESGDLHTGVCMMTWRDLDWKGTGLEALTTPEHYKHNRALANLLFYRVDSYRQASKKLGHATNFLGSPHEISRQTRIPKDLIQGFQAGYLGTATQAGAFPAIKEWHGWLASKLIRDGWITTLTGRRRWFFGRRWDQETVKKAAAYEPQDVEAYINQTGMLQLWRAIRQGDPRLQSIEILLPVHDAILIQYDEEREDELIPIILEIMKVPVPLMHGRVLEVPCDVQVGWNWRHAHNDKKELVNPDGLIDYRGTDTRKRSKKLSILDRRFS